MDDGTDGVIATRPRRPHVDHDHLVVRDDRPSEGYHFAVVDIGSNSVRLVVYDDLSRAPFPRFNEKSLCGLGAGMDKDGRLSTDAIDRTVRALRRFRAIAEAMNVDRLDVFATEATRRAANRDDLVEAIHRGSGLHVNVLSGEEEATYSALGVMSGFHQPLGIAGDMGGGSLEIARIAEDGLDPDTASLPLGTLPVAKMLSGGVRSAKRKLDGILKSSLASMGSAPVFYAIGGGWRALARVHIAMKKPPVRIAHGYEIDAKELRALVDTVLKRDPADLGDLPGVPSRRASTLPAAAFCLDRVVRVLKPEKVVFSAMGLREGWLYDQLAPAEATRDPLIAGAESVAQSTSRVPAMGPALVRWTDGLFPNETPGEKRLRVTACLVSDIAWREHPDSRAAESFFRLLTFPFVGIVHPERAFLAAAIHGRYRGKPDAGILKPAMALLDSERRQEAEILGRALALGYRLSGSVPEILDGARLGVADGIVRLDVADSESAPDSDAVRSRLRQFAKATGLKRAEIRVPNPESVDIIEV